MSVLRIHLLGDLRLPWGAAFDPQQFPKFSHLPFEDACTDIDHHRLLKLCVIHDLGEALHSDIPAIHHGQYTVLDDLTRELRAQIDPVTQRLAAAGNVG